MASGRRHFNGIVVSHRDSSALQRENGMATKKAVKKTAKKTAKKAVAKAVPKKKSAAKFVTKATPKKKSVKKTPVKAVKKAAKKTPAKKVAPAKKSLPAGMNKSELIEIISKRADITKTRANEAIAPAAPAPSTN